MSDTSNNKSSNSKICVNSNANSSNILKPKLKQHNSSKHNYNKFNLLDPTSYDGKAINTLDICKKPKKEINANTLNTTILVLKLKINQYEEPKTFSLGRFDDLNTKIREFCGNNGIEPKFVRPIEHNILTALSKLYITYNISLDARKIDYLNSLKILWNDLITRESQISKNNEARFEADSEAEDNTDGESDSLYTPTSNSCRNINPYSDDEMDYDKSSLKASEGLINRSF
jgi:hypothetical protein